MSSIPKKLQKLEKYMLKCSKLRNIISFFIKILIDKLFKQIAKRREKDKIVKLQQNYKNKNSIEMTEIQQITLILLQNRSTVRSVISLHPINRLTTLGGTTIIGKVISLLK